jgi:putative transposase
MGSVGDCFDNAMCESFFATLECELLNRRHFKSQIEGAWKSLNSLKAGNPHCRHSALGHRSLIDYEKTYYQNTWYRSPTQSTEAGNSRFFQLSFNKHRRKASAHYSTRWN